MSDRLTKKKGSPRFWALDHKTCGVGGVVTRKPQLRKQAKRAKPDEMFAVIFFPKITGIGPAQVGFFTLRDTLSNTPEAAKVRFMDGIAKGERWETYAQAGHRIRRVKISDLGDA